MATRAVSPTVSTVAKEDSLANNETLCVSFETNKAPRNNFFGTSSCAPTKHNDTTTFHAGIEAYKLLYISLPSVIVQFCVRSIFAQTASVVGRLVGVKSLAAFVLASMTANLSTQSVIMGALTAAETRMPRAYGTGHYRQVGVLAIQACFVCIVMLIVPVLILLTCMEIIFATLGQDPEASKLAIEWIRIYMLAIPFSLLFRVIQAFLNAQHVVLPLVLASVGACLVIHPLLLKAIMPTLGLWGSGLCIVLTQGIMVLLVLLYLYIRPESYNRETWPGLSRTLVLESLQPAPLWSFAKQSLGGVVSLSEWWFWDAVCFNVGSFGILPLAIHSIAYNVIPVVFMVAVGLATGLTVRIGNEMGSNHIGKAKQIAAWCMGLAILVGILVAISMYWFRDGVIRLFTKDNQVIEGCHIIWKRVCIFIFILYVFSVNRGILRALGLQWHIAAVVVSCLWCGALPLILYKTVYSKQGFDAVWTILPSFYAVMQVLLVVSYSRLDWKDATCDGVAAEGSPSERLDAEVEMEPLSVGSTVEGR